MFRKESEDDRGIDLLEHVRCRIAIKSRVDDTNVVTLCLQKRLQPGRSGFAWFDLESSWGLSQ